MSKQLDNKRRLFVISLITLSVFPFLFLSQKKLAKKPNNDKILAKKLTHAISSLSDTHDLGKNYLKLFPSENSIKNLIKMIGITNNNQKLNILALPTQTLKRELQKQQVSDFKHDIVVEINGWVLSRTEARLYALKTFA